MEGEAGGFRGCRKLAGMHTGGGRCAGRGCRGWRLRAEAMGGSTPFNNEAANYGRGEVEEEGENG